MGCEIYINNAKPPKANLGKPANLITMFFLSMVSFMTPLRTPSFGDDNRPGGLPSLRKYAGRYGVINVTNVQEQAGRHQQQMRKDQLASSQPLRSPSGASLIRHVGNEAREVALLMDPDAVRGRAGMENGDS